MAHRAKLTRKKRDAFLEIIRNTMNVTEACRQIGLARRTMYDHREKDERFRAEWDAAVETAIESLEGEMYRRAVDGTLRPVFYQGEECGNTREYSDTLAIFLAKATRPDKYRERVDHSVTGNLTIHVTDGD